MDITTGKVEPQANFVLTPEAKLHQTSDHVVFEFTKPYEVLSSAVLNGGFFRGQCIVNMRVDAQQKVTCTAQQSLQRYAASQGWQQDFVGMMTAASMNSCRVSKVHHEGVDMAVVLTLGLSNAGRVGDRADCRALVTPAEDLGPDHGTINILFVTSASMPPSAMVEAVQMITEAKAAALQEYSVKSKVSGLLATGTGTDSVAVACDQEGRSVQYCGKHVLFGELLGRLVFRAMISSLSWYYPGDDGDRHYKS